MMKSIALCAALQGMLNVGAHAAEAPLQLSGVYESLAIAVSPAGDITGYFREEMGEGVTRTCSFMLAGKIGKDRATINSWAPGKEASSKFPGAVKFQGQELVLTLPKGREHPGCGSVLMPEIATGLSFEKTSSAAWISLRQISATRAYFHAAADPSKKQRAFVVAGDMVGVLQEKAGWLRVEYPLGSSPRRQTWIRTSDTALVAPK
jgi:hypothetical protein